VSATVACPSSCRCLLRVYSVLRLTTTLALTQLSVLCSSYLTSDTCCSAPVCESTKAALIKRTSRCKITESQYLVVQEARNRTEE